MFEVLRSYSEQEGFTAWVAGLEPARQRLVSRPGREAISIGVGAVGLAVAGFSVLGRRRAEAK